MLDKVRELKQSASELEGENRELRERLPKRRSHSSLAGGMFNVVVTLGPVGVLATDDLGISPFL